LILGDYKLVKTWKNNRLELFDLFTSASEVEDLAKRLPAKTEELHQLMVEFLHEVKAETRKIGSKGKKSSQ